MQTKQKPPITVKPDAIPMLNNKHMPEIRDMLVEQITKVAEERDVHIHCIVVHPDYAAEYMNEDDRVIFAVYIPADDDTAMAYWQAIYDGIGEAEKKLSQAACELFNNFVASVFVEWLPPDSFYKAIEGNEDKLGEWQSR